MGATVPLATQGAEGHLTLVSAKILSLMHCFSASSSSHDAPCTRHSLTLASCISSQPPGAPGRSLWSRSGVRSFSAPPDSS
eukprot:1567911-Rhodomonas_salina.1